MSTNAKKKTAGYQFHPLEIGIIGYSGSGKTTLIESLIPLMKERWSLAFVKHDAHLFEMDKEGKDTYRAAAAGAEAIFISNNKKHAFLANGEPRLFTQKSQFLDYDAVIVEGHKALTIDKLCFLDDSSSIIKELSPESLAGIKAFIGEFAVAPLLPVDRPYFSRDDIQGITDFIENIWLTQLKARPLKALILAGGKSERMGQDKGLLQYKEKPQALLLNDLLESMGLETYLSLREEQWTESDLTHYRVLHDRFLGFGPLSGILTAMDHSPDSAWLILACDLPMLNASTLRHLIDERNPQKMATAYRSMHDDLPEPLCAIYEPKIRMRLFQAMGLGLSCPRKVLLNSESHILEPIDALALENANTPEDFARFQKLLEKAERTIPHVYRD